MYSVEPELDWDEMYIGCYDEHYNSDKLLRNMEVYLVHDWFGLTQAQCLSACHNLGFMFASLQVGVSKAEVLLGMTRSGGIF